MRFKHAIGPQIFPLLMSEISGNSNCHLKDIENLPGNFLEKRVAIFELSADLHEPLKR